MKELSVSTGYFEFQWSSDIASDTIFINDTNDDHQSLNWDVKVILELEDREWYSSDTRNS